MVELQVLCFSDEDELFGNYLREIDDCRRNDLEEVDVSTKETSASPSTEAPEAVYIEDFDYGAHGASLELHTELVMLGFIEGFKKSFYLLEEATRSPLTSDPSVNDSPRHPSDKSDLV